MAVSPVGEKTLPGQDSKKGSGCATGVWPRTGRAVRPVSRASPFGSQLADTPLLRRITPPAGTSDGRASPVVTHFLADANFHGHRAPVFDSDAPSTRLPRAFLLSYSKEPVLAKHPVVAGWLNLPYMGERGGGQGTAQVAVTKDIDVLASDAAVIRRTVPVAIVDVSYARHDQDWQFGVAKLT